MLRVYDSAPHPGKTGVQPSFVNSILRIGKNLRRTFRSAAATASAQCKILCTDIHCCRTAVSCDITLPATRRCYSQGVAWGPGLLYSVAVNLLTPNWAHTTNPHYFSSRCVQYTHNSVLIAQRCSVLQIPAACTSFTCATSCKTTSKLPCVIPRRVNPLDAG